MLRLSMTSVAFFGSPSFKDVQSTLALALESAECGLFFGIGLPLLGFLLWSSGFALISKAKR